MALPEYRAVIKNGVLEIFPFIEKTTNDEGGTDITIHVPNLSAIGAFKQIILNKLATGEKVEGLEMEFNNGKRNIQQT